MSDATKPKGGRLFYPRNYNITPGDHTKSFCVGVDVMGKDCAVYILPTPEVVEVASRSDNSKTFPKLEEFAKTHRKAMNPCLASAENGPFKAAGILLLEQSCLDEGLSRSHGMPVFVGRWASVIREGDYMPEAPIGRGYVEIGHRKDDANIADLKQKYDDISVREANGLISSIDAEQERQNISFEVYRARSKYFTAVLLKHRELTLLESPTPGSLRELIIGAMTKYTVDGKYGGAMIRYRVGGTVLSTSSFCNQHYQYSEGRVADPNEVFNNWLKWNKAKIKSAVNKGAVVEVIPVQRVNCGPKGNDFFSKEFERAEIPKLFKTYVDSKFHQLPFTNLIAEKAFLYANIAVRAAQAVNGPTAGNVLVSNVHAFSAPMGNAFCIDLEGKPTYTLDVDEHKKKEVIGMAV